MTGRHRSQKQKVRTGQSAVTKADVTCCDVFSLLRVVSRDFSALCVCSTFGHHPHPVHYFCA